jgi:hypothetical protein
MDRSAERSVRHVITAMFDEGERVTLKYMKYAITAVLAFAIGCGGTDIPRPAPGTYEIGRNSYEETLERYNEPQSRVTRLHNGMTIESLIYAFGSQVSSAAHNTNVVLTRGTIFHFHDGSLVGYEFTSSWEVDHSDFDELRVPQIVGGKSQRADVIELFGDPTGYYGFPMTDEKDTNALVYRYNEIQQGGGRTSSFEKLLIVTLDATGTVSDVDLKATSSRIDD